MAAGVAGDGVHLRASQVLNLRVRQFDRVARTVRLNPGETKSGEGRVIKLTSDVAIMLEACVSGKSAHDFVFTSTGGKRVLDFRMRWEKLTEEAGLSGILFHDLRRSSVRNMTRRGIIESVAMKISGHKTRNVFELYNIVSESDLADAAQKIEAGQFGHTLGILEAENSILASPSKQIN